MRRRIPSVRNGALHEDAEETASRETIAVESVAWYAWLEHHRSFRFESPASTFTARKEQRAGGWYWYAYRRQAGRLHTAYLGRSAELSVTRLQAIAAALAGAGEPPTPRTAVGKRRVGPHASHSQEQANIATRRPVPLHNLPRQLTSLVGREQETATAAALLQRPEVHLLSMVGTAGVGKTRLALQIACDLLECFADGVFFVDLAPVRDPELVLSTVAQNLGLRVMRDQSFLDVLKAHLRGKHCLLVLDNFEQVVGAAPQLPDLLRACPDVKLLVTSREALHLRAEHQFSVPPLALPDYKRLPAAQTLAHIAAVELFLQRVQASRTDFELTPSNAAAIAEVCIRLDGLPLAIELAAARSKVFTPQALLSRLERRLQVLTGGARDLPLRQQTLRSTIAWSYELLPREEQRLFRRLAVFAGGCTIEAVEAVSSAVGDGAVTVMEGMISLVDKTLLQHTGRDGEEPRFAMLETIREYGLEALASEGEAHVTRQAHAAYYLRLSERAEPQLDGQEQLSWFQRLEREHDNLRAALTFLVEQGSAGQSKELALRLAGALWRFWLVHGHVSEGRHWLERVLDGSETVGSAWRAKALLGVGALATSQDDSGQAEALCGEGLALYRELGDRRGSALCLAMLGYMAMMRSTYAQARTRLEESLQQALEAGDTGVRVFALQILATVLIYQGEYTRAQALLEESLLLSRERGDVQNHAQSLAQLGHVLLFQGELARAQARLEEGLVISRNVGYKRAIGQSSTLLGMVTWLQGDVARACSLLEESLV
ncbi:MAG: ATP-binding protein, partial [Ktedonobacteraceae bacterium]